MVAADPVMDLRVSETAKDLAHLIVLFDFFAVKKIQATQLKFAHNSRISNFDWCTCSTTASWFGMKDILEDGSYE